MVDLLDGGQGQYVSFGFSSALVTVLGLEVTGSVLLGAAWDWQDLSSLLFISSPTCYTLLDAVVVQGLRQKVAVGQSGTKRGTEAGSGKF